MSEQPTKEDLNMPGDRTSKELVKSLRDYSEGPTFYWGPICQKAAEEIERLQRELAASAAQYQEACDDANRFARERDEARASPEPSALPLSLQAGLDFREWAEKQGDFSFESSKIFGRTYSSDKTEYAWRGWANARAAQPPPALPTWATDPSRDELIEVLEKVTSVPTSGLALVDEEAIEEAGELLERLKKHAPTKETAL